MVYVFYQYSSSLMYYILIVLCSGVPGKFKGCNTCRTRRVKVGIPLPNSRAIVRMLTIAQCDNARPKCQKCVGSGRECGGYERQMIFIVGTTNERGRCMLLSSPAIALAVLTSRRQQSPAPLYPDSEAEDGEGEGEGEGERAVDAAG